MGWASLAGVAGGAWFEISQFSYQWCWRRAVILSKSIQTDEEERHEQFELRVKHFLELSLNKVWNSWTGNKLIMGFYNMHFPYKALKCSIGFMGLVADLLPILTRILGFSPVCVAVYVWGPFSTPDWSLSSPHCHQWSLDGPFEARPGKRAVNNPLLLPFVLVGELFPLALEADA